MARPTGSRSMRPIMTRLLRFHKEAHKYIGVKFRHRGRTDRGLDCVGLVIRAAMDCGYNKYEEEEFAYGREPDSGVLLDVLATHFGEPIDGPPEVNDVALIRLRSGLKPTHVGIITTHPDGLGIIHTHSRIHKVVYQRVSEEMKSLLAGVYRWGANNG